MKMDKVAGSGNDEFYTPRYAIEPLKKYLKEKFPIKITIDGVVKPIIWCPFDTKDSNFVHILEEWSYEVVYTHIENGEDFFKSEPKKYDIIISNPPYSLKAEVLDRLFSLGKPFAMLLGVVGIFESQKRFEMFKNNSFEIMYLNRRVAYFKNFGEQKPSLNPPFSSVYICNGLLPKQIIFEEINKKNV